MKDFLWILAVGIVTFLGYATYVVLDAYAEVKLQPREPMFLCNKHGMIRQQHLIHFQSAPDTFIDYCPICFDERLKSVEKIN